ncbi:uncharacterized protein LOC111700981 [Eurytemora carolleeae]|uniref:uncharacterized protein LOC111700981 n=1 Tax=Eurytemora carolleeae TaxID=1294199 RepID=UPI000C7897EC|nr:uncharacterized protein LOC111700981 [Eurytemora carolleeae]|eukprot:XP_023327847.1 uncharacterized protein LOC111700981 [Eurytemora affinis]
MEQTEVLPYNGFADAIVTREDGLPATIFDILPTKTSAAAPAFDPESFNVDAVIDQNESVVSSGKVEWRDVYARGFTPCGRTDGRRPRILEIVTGNTTVTSFATVLTTSIVPTTVTFSVTLTCTTAGFTFGVPAC